MATACNFAAVFQILSNSGMIEDKDEEFKKYSKEMEAARKISESRVRKYQKR